MNFDWQWKCIECNRGFYKHNLMGLTTIFCDECDIKYEVDLNTIKIYSISYIFDTGDSYVTFHTDEKIMVAYRLGNYFRFPIASTSKQLANNIKNKIHKVKIIV